MTCKFRIPPTGKRAIWEITERCNLSCSYCMFASNPNPQHSELTTDECYHVIDELVGDGFTELKITGGEPFTRKDIIDILQYAGRYLKIDISTNGTLITEEIAKSLNECNLSMIHVSLDGTRDLHEALRGKNTFDRALRGISYLSTFTNTYVRVGSVLCKKNEYNIRGTVVTACMLGAKEIIFSIMEPVGKLNGSKENYITLSPTELASAIESLREDYPILINYNWDKNRENACEQCVAGERFIFINSEGKVSPCTWVRDNNNIIYYKKSLREVPLVEILKEGKIWKRVKCYSI